MVLAIVLWTLGGAVVTFVVAAFIWVAILLMLKDNVKKEEKKLLVTLAVGSENVCSRVARRIQPCPQLHRKTITCPVDEILKYITNGNRVLLFIVKKELSGEVAALVSYLQMQVDKHYNNEAVAHKQLYQSLRYAVFGIGDSSEARDEFNRLAMKIDLNLRILGATRVAKMHLYDATTSPISVEEEFSEWFNNLIPETQLSIGPTRVEDETLVMKGILANQTSDAEEIDEDTDNESIVKELTLEPAAEAGSVPQESPEVSPEDEQSVPTQSVSTEEMTTPSSTITVSVPISPKRRSRSNSRRRRRSRSSSKSSRKGRSKERSRSKSRSTFKEISKDGSPEATPRGRGTLDVDESSPDDDWEVMEMPTTEDTTS